MTDPREVKKRHRAGLRARLAAVSAADIATWSGQIVARIETLPEYAAARTVLIFVPMANRPEVNLRPLIQSALAAGKAVCLPRTDWTARTMTARRVTDLAELEPDAAAPAAAGLWHPRESCPIVPPQELDLLLTPGLGFDLTGGRIGHGAGFYDRFLAQPSVRGVVCGVGLEAQLLAPGEELPRDLHDQPVEMLVTESRVIRYDRSGAVGQAAPG